MLHILLTSKKKKGRKSSDDYKTFCLQLQPSTVSFLQQRPPRQLQSETGFQNKLKKLILKAAASPARVPIADTAGICITKAMKRPLAAL